MRMCAERDANGITEPRLSPVDNLSLEFGFPIGAVPEDVVWEVSDQCLQRYLWTVEVGFRTTHPAVMDADIKEAAIVCMAALGYEISTEVRNVADMAEEIPGEARSALLDCVSSSVLDLRPDLDNIGVSL